MRRFVIGDVHGCGRALASLIAAIAPESDDEVTFLGDYIDRGPESRSVIEQILQLKRRCRVVALRGNHEVMFMRIMDHGGDPAAWLRCGGSATLASYGGTFSGVPASHLDFLRSLVPFHQTETDAFVHASYRAAVALHHTDDSTLYWRHLSPPYPGPHVSGKRFFLGHTPQTSGRVLDHGHLVCLDTHCFGGGCLTGMEIETGALFCFDRHGGDVTPGRRGPSRGWVSRMWPLRRRDR